MGDLVNLRLARKRQARSKAEAAAAEQRIRHGRTRAERVAVAAEIDRAARGIEAHRLAPATPLAPSDEGPGARPDRPPPAGD